METDLDGRDSDVIYTACQPTNSTEQEVVRIVLAQQHDEPHTADYQSKAIVISEEDSDGEGEQYAAASSIMATVEHREGNEGYQSVHATLEPSDLSHESVVVLNATPVGPVFLKDEITFEDTGEKQFKCRVDGCNKVFATGNGLKCHTRTHTKERAHICPHGECGKAFKTSGDLKKHVHRHTGSVSADGKRQRSAVWHYFIKCEGTGTSQCTVCSEVVKHANNTSNLFKHLQVKHPQQYQQAEKQREENEEIAAKRRKTGIKKETPMKLTGQPVQQKYPSDSLRRKNIDEAIARMVSIDMQPPSIVDDLGFQSLVQLLDPRYILPSKKHITKDLLPAMYTKVVEEMKEELAQISHVALSSEVWTSKSTEPYMTITCHFLTSSWDLKSLVLETFGLKRSPSTEIIASSFKRVAEAWEISKKIVAMVTDGTANVVDAVRIAGWMHVPCFAHTLDLTVSEAIKADTSVQELRSRCRQIVSFFHNNVKATEKLNAIQRQLSNPEQKLIQEVETRWNSTYHMFQRIAEQQQAITTALCLSSGNELCLSSSDVDMLKSIMTFLKPFEATTSEMAADQCVSVSKVIPLATSLQHLTSRITITKEIHVPLVSELKDQMQRNFRKLESSQLLALSTILDPRLKKVAFRDSVVAQQAEQRIIQEMSGLVPADSNQQTAETPAATGLWDLFDAQVAQSQLPRKGTNNAKLEAMKFFEEPLLRRNEDPLVWWRDNERSYQLLSQLAKKYLCIPGTSFPAERLFSKEGELTSFKRNRLKPKNIHMFLFLHQNL